MVKYKNFKLKLWIEWILMKTVFIYLGKLIRINNWSKATLANQLLQNARIFITLAILSIIGDILNEKLLIAPFGASCIIMYSLPKSGFSNPLNIIGSYFICSIVGVVFYSLLGNNCWGIALAVSLAVLIMILTNLMHPPAGAVTIIAITTSAKWLFVINPVAIGTFCIVAIAILFNSIQRRSQKFYFAKCIIKSEIRKRIY